MGSAIPEEEPSQKIMTRIPPQIRSLVVINAEGKTLVERNYWIESETLPDLNLFGGFIAAIARMCEDVAQDEVREILLGAAQFLSIRSDDLLIIFHVGFEYPRLLAMAKLRRIRDLVVGKQKKLSRIAELLVARQEEWQIASQSWDALKDSSILRSLLSEIDGIVFEQTTVDLEQVLDYYLTGENILGVELRDAHTDEILFTHNASGNENMLGLNSVLTRVFLEIFSSQYGPPFDSKPMNRFLVSRIGKLWLCGVQQGDLVFTSLFDRNIDQSVILDILHGNIGETLCFVAQYFREMA